MNRIPCKKCPQCGLFNDFTVEKCECGKKLNNVESQFIDTELISPELYGDIDTTLKVYVQKCSACGAVNYTNNPASPVKICYNCHKTRIATIVPMEYVDEESDAKLEVSELEDRISGNTSSLGTHQAKVQIVQGQRPYETDDDDDDDSAHWKSILANIQRTIGGTPVTIHATSSQPICRKTEEVKSTQTQSDFDDDDETGDWSGILGISPKQKTTSISKQQPVSASPVKKDITLTAIRYGRLTFTVEAGQEKYMLGRSANQESFLSQDGRVGNEHCYLFYRDGAWYVKDNNSKNGTAVNSQDIGLNGERMLSDGDELKLGHHPDSMAFRISVV